MRKNDSMTISATVRDRDSTWNFLRPPGFSLGSSRAKPCYTAASEANPSR